MLHYCILEQNLLTLTLLPIQATANSANALSKLSVFSSPEIWLYGKRTFARNTSCLTSVLGDFIL